MSQLIGQNIITGLSGKSLTSEEKSFLTENDIGGVILFARNVEDPMQVWGLCNEIQGLRTQTASKAPFFISIDMEGGRVHRLKAPFTQWPALAKVGQLDSPSVAYNFAFMMGEELKAVGINLDFAPCIDVLTNPKNSVIGDRAISSDPEQVAKLSSALTRGYIKAGIIPCAKHYPGHGNTLVDSHEDLPRETASLDRLMDVELVPFKKAFKARLELVMAGHLFFENIDAKDPVTFSKYFLKDLLRNELRYRGLVITDDLDMGALIKHYDREEIPVKALQAGCDILLYCNDPTSPVIAVEALNKALAEDRLDRSELEMSRNNILGLKKKFLGQVEGMKLADLEKLIGKEEHSQVAKAIALGKMPELKSEA